MMFYRVFQKKWNIAIFSLNLFQRSDYAFSQVFRNQNFEPIRNLNTLNMPIQNTKCPEGLKLMREPVHPEILSSWSHLSDVFDSSASNEKIGKECRTLFCVNCIAQSEENIQLKQLNALVLISIGTSNQWNTWVRVPKKGHTWQHYNVCVFWAFRAFNILNGYVQSVEMEWARKSVSETPVKKHNRTSGTDLS